MAAVQVHGSAPDIAGQDIANPMAMVLSAAMMCRYSLDLPQVRLAVCSVHARQLSSDRVPLTSTRPVQVADSLENAVKLALDKGYRTSDLMSPGMQRVGCRQMGEILAEGVAARAPVAA